MCFIFLWSAESISDNPRDQAPHKEPEYPRFPVEGTPSGHLAESALMSGIWEKQHHLHELTLDALINKYPHHSVMWCVVQAEKWQCVLRFSFCFPTQISSPRKWCGSACSCWLSDSLLASSSLCSIIKAVPQGYLKPSIYVKRVWHEYLEWSLNKLTFSKF